MARTKLGEMKKKQKAAAGRVSKSSHGNHHDLDVGMIEKKLGKKVQVNKKGSYDPYAVESDEDTVPISSTRAIVTAGRHKWPQKGGMCIQHFNEAQDAASGN